MNENVGSSFGLSVLTVVFFAVVLYQPDSPPPRAASVPGVATAEPLEADPPAAPTEHQRVRKSDPPRGPGKPSAVKAPEGSASRPARRPQPEEPRGEFTKVREGETLADVAARVYGTAEEAKSLWQANRDQLDRADSPVPAGSILRTP